MHERAGSLLIGQLPNRRVSSDLLENPYGEDIIDLARLAIEKQDDEISQRSGVRKPRIKSVKLV